MIRNCPPRGPGDNLTRLEHVVQLSRNDYKGSLNATDERFDSVCDGNGFFVFIICQEVTTLYLIKLNVFVSASKKGREPQIC